MRDEKSTLLILIPFILYFFTENFQILVNYSKFLIKLKTSVGFTAVKLE